MMAKRTCRDEAGSVSALVVGLVMTFIACAGLAVDGGRMVAAKIQASDMAENAARTGAQALTGIRLGVPRIEPRSARRLAAAYLSSVGAAGSVEASQQEVCVTIRKSKEMTLLSLVGVSPKTVVATRCARAIQGGDQ
jgi:Flp pilus assembly protein TadG